MGVLKITLILTNTRGLTIRPEAAQYTGKQGHFRMETEIQKLVLTDREFDGSEVMCLGSQLAKIVQGIELRLPGLFWYSADVSGSDVDSVKFEAGPRPRLVGTANDLIVSSNKVTQFYSGVFLACKQLGIDFGEQECFTEDPEDRYLPNVEIEIRAFDTSFFEIYSKNKGLIAFLNRRA
jgi:hypothetical protein